MVSLFALFIWEWEPIFMHIMCLLVTCNSFFFLNNLFIFFALFSTGLWSFIFCKNCLEREDISLLL